MIGRRAKQAGILTLALATVTAIGLVMFWENVPWPSSYSLAFDSVKWKSTRAEFSEKSIRLRMVDDLLANHPLVGLDRAAIVALLGEPDKTPYKAEYDMVYFLGPERSWISVDSEWLVIKLDSAGVATKAAIATD